jgi:hypothetical protein
MTLMEIWSLELQRHGFTQELCELFDMLKRDDSDADKLLHHDLPMSLVCDARSICQMLLDSVIDKDKDAHREAFAQLKQLIVRIKNSNGQ